MTRVADRTRHRRVGSAFRRIPSRFFAPAWHFGTLYSSAPAARLSARFPLTGDRSPSVSVAPSLAATAEPNATSWQHLPLGALIETIGSSAARVARSIVYYRSSTDASPRLGACGLHIARLVLGQTDFEQIERNQREGRGMVVELLARGQHRSGGRCGFLYCLQHRPYRMMDRSAVDLRPAHRRSDARRSGPGFAPVGLLGVVTR